MNNLLNYKKYNFWPWFICFLLMSFILCLTNFQSDSHDSQFYHFLVEQMTALGPKKLFLVEWKGHYGSHGLVQDHFMGHIILGYILTFIGIPAKHSLHILNIFFLMSSIFLLYKMSNRHRHQAESSLLLLLLLFLPISFSYGLRGNHEASMTFFLLLFIFGHQLYSSNKFLALLFLILGAHGFLLVKGILVLLLIPLSICAEFIIGKRSWARCLLFCIIVLSSAIAALLYDYFYQIQVGSSFLGKYFDLQISQRTLSPQGVHSFPIKFKVLFYYLTRSLLYSLPWSLCAFILIIKNASMPQLLLKALKSPWSLFLLCASLTYIICMSVFDRSASRYIFPVYYMLSACFIFISLDLLKPRQKEFLLSKLTIQQIPYLSALLYLVIFLFHLLHYYQKGT